jgi:hypothetical protein
VKRVPVTATKIYNENSCDPQGVDEKRDNSPKDKIYDLVCQWNVAVFEEQRESDCKNQQTLDA